MSDIQNFLDDTYRAFLGFGLAMAIVWILTPMVGEFARRMGIIDLPAARKIHAVPTPRLGGIAIFFGIIIPSLMFLSGDPVTRGILAGASLAALLGLVDDVRDVPPKVKLLGQVAIALMIVLYGVRVETLTVPFLGIVALGWVGVVFSVIWVVAIMNIVNFIDGMDGLAAGISTIASATFAIIAISLGRYDMGILAAILAGSTVGFLWHNFHPASIFMGDSGSLLLGFLLAAISLQGFLKGVATVALLIPLAVLGIPIFDTSFAILRRVKNRRPIYVADRGHFHHRFSNLGYSQRQTVVILYSWSASLSVVALAMRFAPVWLTLLLSAAVGAYSAFLAYELEILRWSKLVGRPARTLAPSELGDESRDLIDEASVTASGEAVVGGETDGTAGGGADGALEKKAESR